MHERMVLILKESVVRINEKVVIHFIKTDKFKSNAVAAFLLTELNRENITKNALIPAVLRRGTESLNTMKDISIKMDDLTAFPCFCAGTYRYNCCFALVIPT